MLTYIQEVVQKIVSKYMSRGGGRLIMYCKSKQPKVALLPMKCKKGPEKDLQYHVSSMEDMEREGPKITENSRDRLQNAYLKECSYCGDNNT